MFSDIPQNFAFDRGSQIKKDLIPFLTHTGGDKLQIHQDIGNAETWSFSFRLRRFEFCRNTFK